LKKLTTKYLFLVLSILCGYNSLAQNVLKNEKQPKEHSPSKAILYSIIPGGGQVYNEKYWKVPVLYAGLAATVYAIDFNTTKYEKYRDALDNRDSEEYDILTDKYKNLSDNSLENLRDAYRNDRDLSIFIGVGIYAINLLDAYVDAHFFEFDVSDDLSLQVQPSIQINPDFSTANGLSLSIRF